MSSRKMKINQLKFDSKNANKGTERGRKALTHSLSQYGAGRSILVDKKGRVIAGNKTLEQAIAAGHQDIVVVKTDGTKLVAVQRVDLDLNSKKAKALALADNRVGELDLEWDQEILGELKKELDLSELWTDDELKKLVSFTAAEGTEEQDMSLKHSIIVDCVSEKQQAELLKKFEKQGLKCRLLIS
jgi:hypothetical protein